MQFFITLSLLAALCTGMLLLSAIVMLVVDYKGFINMLYHAPVTSTPMPNMHHVQNVVRVSDTRKLLSYDTYMTRMCANIGIVRTVDNAWTTSIVDSCAVYTHNIKKGV